MFCLLFVVFGCLLGCLHLLLLCCSLVLFVVCCCFVVWVVCIV